ncbi:hypothetical protein BDP27DRAFT_1441858 [Rhodocollybia butyracea]|uniref:Uncharacterized protein n=1 Tax=Rhodocollybia butyracea TaxID=206335 RepID=A0A9P5QAU0_9AGAR|nr:hypothetical protein BDP27DRAFT_1441858 [Rhodocollybia butyracea]
MLPESWHGSFGYHPKYPAQPTECGPKRKSYHPSGWSFAASRTRLAPALTYDSFSLLPLNVSEFASTPLSAYDNLLYSRNLYRKNATRGGVASGQNEKSVVVAVIAPGLDLEDSSKAKVDTLSSTTLQSLPFSNHVIMFSVLALAVPEQLDLTSTSPNLSGTRERYTNSSHPPHHCSPHRTNPRRLDVVPPKRYNAKEGKAGVIVGEEDEAKMGNWRTVAAIVQGKFLRWQFHNLVSLS